MQSNNQFRVGIITASDKGALGEREDISGAVIREIVEQFGYRVVSYTILPDVQGQLEQEMIRLADGGDCDLILTTGGTGFSPRDITPEATKKIIERSVPGISEAIRAYSMSITKRAMLSRGISGIRNKTLIINLPGSPKAVSESLEYIIGELDHGLSILCEITGECARKD
jgi:molybdopterin adenylyltransferase